MKLYATVTSERASKSQGGNDYVKIALQRDRERVEYHILYTPDGRIRVSMPTDSGGVELFSYQEKGKKQKSELCKICDGDFSNPHVCI
jgi:hypothetical protein